MALTLPQQGRNVKPLQLIAPEGVPPQEIIAARGQNPYAGGISEFGEALSQAIQKRATLVQQKQLADEAQREQLVRNRAINKQIFDVLHVGNDTGHNASSGLGSFSGETYQPMDMDPQTYLGAEKEKIAQEKAGAVKWKTMGLDSTGKNAVEQDGGGNYRLTRLPTTVSGPLAPIVKPSGGDAATKQASKDEESWVKLGTAVNGLQKSSRSALGAAAIANQRADRALAVTNDPNATPQQLNQVVQDLAGIFQNGSPHETSMNQQDYMTLKTKALNLLTFITANPQAARQPEIQQKLRDTVSTIKQVDNKIVKDNTGIEAVAFEGLIKKDPQRWQRMMDAVSATTDNPGLQPIQTGYSDAEKEARYQAYKAKKAK